MENESENPSPEPSPEPFHDSALAESIKQNEGLQLALALTPLEYMDAKAGAFHQTATLAAEPYAVLDFIEVTAALPEGSSMIFRTDRDVSPEEFDNPDLDPKAYKLMPGDKFTVRGVFWPVPATDPKGITGRVLVLFLGSNVMGTNALISEDLSAALEARNIRLGFPIPPYLAAETHTETTNASGGGSAGLADSDKPPPRVVHTLTAGDRLPTLRPHVLALEAMGDKSKNRWKAVAEGKRIEFRAHANEPLILYYDSVKDGPIPANAFKSQEALKSFLSDAWGRVVTLGPLEQQMLIVLLIHGEKCRAHDPTTGWFFLSLEMIGKYLGKTPEKWTLEQRQTHGAALDNVLALKAEGLWKGWPKGINKDAIEYTYRASALIHHEVIQPVHRVDKGGQSSMVTYPARIRYNLGADFEHATRPGMKRQDTILPQGVLLRDYSNEAEVISLAIQYALSFRVDGQRPHGVVAGWTFRRHLDAIGWAVPAWANQPGRGRQFMTRVMPIIEAAAADAGGHLRIFNEVGHPVPSWDADLKRGQDGLKQWLARTCQVVPVSRGVLALVQGVTHGRKTAVKAAAKMEGKAKKRTYKGRKPAS